MKQCVSELCVGDYCDSAHRCLLEDGHEGPHEFVGWLSNGVQDGWDEAEIVVRVESGEGSAAGEGVGTQASPPPPGSYEQAKTEHTLAAQRMIQDPDRPYDRDRETFGPDYAHLSPQEQAEWRRENL